MGTRTKLRPLFIVLVVFIAVAFGAALGIWWYSGTIKSSQVTTALDDPAKLADRKPVPKDQVWGVISEYTHDTLNAENALRAPDQKTATILPGGALALDYVDGKFFGHGPGADLRIYGPEGDKVSYTVFVRYEPTDTWVHIDINRNGFSNGVAYHDMGHHGVSRAKQIMIRNDAPTNLYIDAVVAVYKDQADPANDHHHH